MKVFMGFAAALLLGISILVVHGPVQAQSASPSGPVLVMAGTVGSPASCAWPSGITVTSGFALCPTSQGLYYALNGQLPFVPVAPPAAAQSTPTSVACATASISGAGLTASSCTIK